MAHAAQSPTYNVIGHYRILAELGSGGMGHVYKAFDTKLERSVALKFITHTKSDIDERDRVLREARTASSLRHKNIATIYSVDEEENGEIFIVMEYHEGSSLDARMCKGPLTRSETLHILHDIAEGLSHAHSHNVIHRDIKPSNIMLTHEGTAIIVDFGLASIVSSDSLTRTVNLAGTLRYMSPEQLAGDPADARSDIWSLGVIAYQMVTGDFPFLDSNPAATIDSILHAKIDFGKAPVALRPVLEKCLCRNAATRYQTCTELLRDLELAEQRMPNVVAAQTGVASRRRFHLLRRGLPQWSIPRKRRAGAIATVALVVGLGVAFSNGLQIGT